MAEGYQKEMRIGSIIVIACLMTIALAVVYMAMDRLHAILIPFVLALALSYLLSPLVDLLSCDGRLPRVCAVLTAFLLGCLLLLFVGLVLLQALYTFQQRSALYSDRVEALLEKLFTAVAELQAAFHAGTGGGRPSAGDNSTRPFHSNHTAAKEAEEMVSHFLKDVSLTNLILSLLGTAAHIAEDVMYIVLFLVFMLLPHGAELSAQATREGSVVAARVERQIHTYIQGKSAISAFVGGAHGLVLWTVGLQGLWLPFGVLTFFLNFIPNVGGMGAVLLPLPLVALDPQFSPMQSWAAFAVPFCVNIFAKDVLEPKVLGHATDLQPVAILLAILIYGSVWGITGMVLAIPLTAVLRIYLASLRHPIPRWMASKLAGREQDEDEAEAEVQEDASVEGGGPAAAPPALVH